MFKHGISFLLLMAAVPLAAAVTMPGIFSDHAVLAKRHNVPVFGSAAPGEPVKLTFAGKTYTTAANAGGKWIIHLDLTGTAPGPHVLQVNDVTIKDVLVGEVFLASGQSNMAFRLNRAEGFRQIRELPANNYLRWFNTGVSGSKEPAEKISGKWEIASPRTVGNCSAVSYFFAAELQKKLQVPVAIINSSVGGTEIECWMSKEALAPFPDAVKAGKKREYLYESYPRRHREFLQKNPQWEKQFNRTDDLPLLPEANAVWKTAKPPVAFGNGIFFLRTTVNISPADAAKGFQINLRRTHTPMTLFIDGKCVKSCTAAAAYKQEYFLCNIPAGQVAPGRHEIMLRYFVSHDRVRLPRIVHFGNTAVSETDWEIFCAKNFGAPDAAARRARPVLPGMRPSSRRLWSYLYNGMIHPLIPYRLSGVIWYQGESNEKNAAAYRQLFPAFIRDIRKKFADPALPFYFCQLAAYRDKSPAPDACGTWPALRDAQSHALTLPGTGMAVLTDAGEARDIHPLDKRTPGTRLAKLALQQIYGQNIAVESPTALHAQKNNHTVTVQFSGCQSGLTVHALPEYHYLKRSGNQRKKLLRNSPAAQVEGFALAGADGKWYWADRAEISGDRSVTVSSDRVADPVKIRFGWMDNPTVNLYNRAGFPAIPFELSVK